jgi:hypothetical protein
MEKETTRRLEEKLVQITHEDILTDYLDDPHIFDGNMTFAEYFMSLEKVKQMREADLVKASGIERSYCYQLLNGTRPNPGRDKIIRLCLAAKLSVKESCRALKVADEAVLYARNRRDAIITYCIQNGLSAEETNILLDHFSEKPLE